MKIKEKCSAMPRKTMWLDEISSQEDNAVIRDLFSFYIEGTDNSVAQQIRIRRQIVLHQSIRVLLQLWSSVVEKSGGN
jgi:hypothetical protein